METIKTHVEILIFYIILIGLQYLKRAKRVSEHLAGIIS